MFKKSRIFAVLNFKHNIMATVTLEYNARSIQAQKTLE